MCGFTTKAIEGLGVQIGDRADGTRFATGVIGVTRFETRTPAHSSVSDMSILNRLFPETLFPRKLSADAEQRLRLVQARAEEALIRTHVENALLFVDTLSTDVGYERALDIYVREMSVSDPLASVVAKRALVTLGEALVPAATLHAAHDEGTAEAVPMPTMRLDEAAARRHA